MESEQIEIEGTWEEIASHADQFAGRRVRLIVLPSYQDEQNSTARSILKHAGAWMGDDLPRLLQEVRETRSQAVF